MFKEMASETAYRLLESGPIVMVTTRAGDGAPNVMTMSFHMMMQHEPALIGVVLEPWDHTFNALQESGECVIAVPTIDLAQTVVDVRNCSGAQLDKFETFGLATMPSRHVRAPSIMECIANARNSLPMVVLGSVYEVACWPAELNPMVDGSVRSDGHACS